MYVGLRVGVHEGSMATAGVRQRVQKREETGQRRFFAVSARQIQLVRGSQGSDEEQGVREEDGRRGKGGGEKEQGVGASGPHVLPERACSRRTVSVASHSCVASAMMSPGCCVSVNVLFCVVWFCFVFV